MALPPQPDSPAPAGEATLPAAPALPPAPAAPAPPAPAARPAHSLTPMVLTGGVVGLIAGLAAGYDHFRKQPAVYESTALVSGTDPAAVMTPAVLDRAARRLDAMAPFAPPLPGTTSERVAYLNQNLSLQMRDGAVRLAFRGPNPADTPKYLRAVAEAYAAPAARPVQPPLPPAPDVKAPPAAPPPPSPAPVDADAAVAAERAKLQAELAAVTSEPILAVEKRLEANQTALKTTQAKLTTTNGNLEAIAGVGSDKAARLALMKKLGVTPDPDRPAAPTAEEKAWQAQLVTFEQKKAELGRRLGPEHRDMLALEEQITFVRASLDKAAAARPTEDALDRHHAALTKTWAKLNADASALAESVQRDEATLAAAAPIRARLDALRPAAPQPLPPMPVPDPFAVAPQPRPAAPPTPAGPEILSTPTTGERVSPLLYQSLVPGGGIGLFAGLGLGFLAFLVTGAIANRPARERKPKPVAPPKPVVLSGVVRRTGTTRIAKYDGPALSVPVLAQVPALKPDAPVEKKSVEGWSPALVSFSRPNSAEAEAYRAARRALVEALGSAGHKAVVVTGPGGGGDGKTTTAANLALSLAQSGKRVLLIDCDYHGTKQQELFRLGRLGDSLKSVMMNDVDLRSAVRGCEVANLFLLPAGRGPVDGADVLTRAKFKDLVAELKSQYEYVILDAPPTTADAELKALAEQADGMVLVVRNDPDAARRVETATSEVARAGSKVLGAVVTAAPVKAAPAATEQTTPTAV